MSQTIIALSSAEQLSALIPGWQQHNIQFANTSEHLNLFQSADCILCLPDTPASLLGAAWQHFPESRFFIIQDEQQWLDGQTRQSVDFNQALSAFKQSEKKQQAAAALPKQTQTKQPSNPSNEMSDNALLFEIFKFATWGLDSKDNREKVGELLYLATRRGKELSSRAQQRKKQGERARLLAQELEALFKKGDQTALNTWFDGQQARPELSQLIKKHLTIRLDKLNKKKDKKKTFTPAPHCTVRPPRIYPSPPQRPAPPAHTFQPGNRH